MTPRLDEDRLRAYADGELDARHAAEVEAWLDKDPEAAAFVEREQALRQRLQAAFAPVLDEPVPERLRQALQAAPRPSPVGGFEPVTVPPQRRLAANAPWWAGIAAALVLGVGIGHLWQGPSGTPSPLATAADGTLVAAAPLAEALSRQPAGQAAGPVQVAWTFRDRGGAWCRTFVLPAQSAAGLACRDQEAWRVQVLARQNGAAVAPGGYRQAATALPPAVLQAVDARIAGSPLDAAAEAEALRRGFQR